MANIRLDLDWFRCPTGYRIADRWSLNPDEVHHIENVDVVARTDAAKEPYRPFDQPGADTLYIEFANVRTAADLLNFIEKNGPLTSNAPNWGDDIAGALKTAGSFRELMDRKRAGPRSLAAYYRRNFSDRIAAYHVASVALAADAKSGVRLNVRPDGMIGGLWWQIGQSLSGIVAVSMCRHCGCWFETGPKAGRRADAEFCTDEHRITFNSRKRTQGG